MSEFKINAKGLQCPGPIVQLFTQIKQGSSRRSYYHRGYRSRLHKRCKRLVQKKRVINYCLWKSPSMLSLQQLKRCRVNKMAKKTIIVFSNDLE